MTEAAGKVDFSIVRYAQLWEDADTLLAGLDVRPGETCLSIASAGDNALALLTRDPAKVIAVDLNPVQLACVRLRIAAYRTLEHVEYLELFGSTLSDRREALYRRCRTSLSEDDARFWDHLLPEVVRFGIGGVGKFEAYFRTFRRWVMPLVHSRKTIEALFEPRDSASRLAFYRERWNTRRWRAIFAVFFSRFVMGRLGRDPAMFDYVDVPVSQRIFQRAEHALSVLDPSANPYLQWILLGRHASALPLALRSEHYDVIRSRLDRLDVRLGSVESALDAHNGHPIMRFNLSDIFEYMSPPNYETALRRILRMRATARGSRTGTCSRPARVRQHWPIVFSHSTNSRLSFTGPTRRFSTAGSS
ncbi:MAG: DUF3419 family protein [Tepidisphaeraceae bacterium]